MHWLRKPLSVPDRTQTGRKSSTLTKLLKGFALNMILLGIVVSSVQLWYYQTDGDLIVWRPTMWSVDPEDVKPDLQKSPSAYCQVDPDLCEDKVLANIKGPELVRRLREARECLEYGDLLKYGDCIDYDSIIDGLGRGEVAFNKPDRMQFRRPETIQLAIAPAPERRPAAAGLVPRLHGEIRVSELALTRIMTAELRSAEGEFAISPEGPQERLVAGTEPMPWTWEVKPLVYGEDKRLTIEVMGILRIGDERAPPRPVQTFIESFSIEVSTWDRTVHQLSQLAPVWGVPAGLVAGGWALFLYARRRGAAVAGDPSGGAESANVGRSSSADPNRLRSTAEEEESGEPRDSQKSRV